MKTRDRAFVGSGIVVSFSAAGWAHGQGLAAEQIAWSGVLSQLAVVVLLVGTVFAGMSREYYGGAVGRGLGVIAAGLLVYGVVYWPHKTGVPILSMTGLPLVEGWHGSGEPAWFGIVAPAWQTFFHLLTAITLGVVAYGFYVIWRSGKA